MEKQLNEWERIPQEERDHFQHLDDYSSKIRFWIRHNLTGSAYGNAEKLIPGEIDSNQTPMEATIVPKTDEEAQIYYEDYYRLLMCRDGHREKHCLKKLIKKVESALEFAPSREIVLQSFIDELPTLETRYPSNPRDDEETKKFKKTVEHLYRPMFKIGYDAAIQGRAPKIKVDYLGSLLNILEGEIYAGYKLFLDNKRRELTSSVGKNPGTFEREETLPGRWNFRQKIYFLSHFGLFDNSHWNKKSQGSKHQILARLLECDVDNAKKILNSLTRPTQTRYSITEDDKRNVEEFLKKLS